MSKYSSLLPSALILCPFLDRHPVINVLQTFYTLLILMPPLRTKAQIAKNLRHIRFSALTTEKAKLTYFRSHLPTQVHSISKAKGKDIRPGDCVILDIAEDDSGTSTQDDLCIAEIQDLRSDGDKGKEYALIRWFYTGSMLGRLPKNSIKDLSTHVFSPYELVLSDHEQVFPVAQILQKVVVRAFNEFGAEQPVINVGEWWYRYFWPTKQNRLLMSSRAELPPAKCAMAETCIKERYTPSTGRQLYCPRNSCHLWFHRECLVYGELNLELGEIDDRLQLMLRGTPGFEWIDMDEEADAKFFEQVKICIKYIGGIVACAQHSVVRGKGHGVVGNYQAIKRARGLLQQARWHDEWPSDDDIKEFAAWQLPTGLLYQCTRCKEAI